MDMHVCSVVGEDGVVGGGVEAEELDFGVGLGAFEAGVDVCGMCVDFVAVFPVDYVPIEALGGSVD